MGQGCRLFKRCRNQPPGHCGAGCLSGVRTYLQGTVGQWYRLFKRCQHLPLSDSVAIVQSVYAVLEPTSQAGVQPVYALSTFGSNIHILAHARVG